MSDTTPPITDAIPTVGARARSRFAAFWDIPVVGFLEYALPVAIVAAVIYWLATNGWVQ